MRPHFKVVKISKEDNRDKKMLCFLVDPLLYEHCVNSSSCLLIEKGSRVEGDILTTEVVVALALEFWRLEKRLNRVRETLKSAGQDCDAVFDQLQRIKDFLLKNEIEIKEHTGESYDDGLSLRPHFEIDENMPKGVMKIIETVKPSIYYKSKIIMHGDVVVAKSKDN